MAKFGFKMARSRLQMANLSFQRGPGQDLAENGPFAFKLQKKFIEQKYGFHFGTFGLQTRPTFAFQMAHSRPQTAYLIYFFKK